jgi:hypothetical protein
MNQNVSKLPKWAQKRIECLECAVVRAEKQIERLKKELAGETQTSVMMNPYDDNPRFLQDNEFIRFCLDDNPEKYIDVKLHRGKLGICGVHMITVVPVASNAIEIDVRDD